MSSSGTVIVVFWDSLTVAIGEAIPLETSDGSWDDGDSDDGNIRSSRDDCSLQCQYQVPLI